MLYEELAKVYFRLETTSSTIAKTKILAELFKKTPKELLRIIVLLSQGQVFPPWMNKELRIGENLAMQAISRAIGVRKDEIIEAVKKYGDLGSACEALLKRRKQVTLFQEELTVKKVYDTFVKIAEAEGEGSIDAKVSYLSSLISSAKPIEGKYIIRTVLGELRIGVGEGIVRDAIAEAFRVDAELVEIAYAILNDFGEVAELAMKGNEALRNVKLKPGRPIKVMLYHKAESISEALEKTGTPAQVEYKYDGFRTLIHKIGDKIIIFTRRLEDVTKQFPDVVERARRAIKAREAIIDSETIGFDPSTGRWLPFQRISQRIKRKYDIEKMAKEIPVKTRVFDVLYVDGENLIFKPLKERWAVLEKIIAEEEEFKLAEHARISSSKEGEEFYEKALKDGAEGIMIKNLNAPYKPGQRTGYGYKLKPTMETLDVVIIGAEWGEGKRAHWLSSFLLGVRDPETGEFLPIGKMGTGLTEAQFEMFTQMLKPLIIEEKGKEVKIKPKIVVEVSYQEIQKSPKYASGFALRFPRFVRLREDKGPEEADTIERVALLYEKQKK